MGQVCSPAARTSWVTGRDLRLLARSHDHSESPSEHSPRWLGSPYGYPSFRSTRGDWTDRGIADEAKGKLKEATGTVTGSDDLRREGQAQQHKGQQEKAAEARATAEEHEQEAERAERAEQKHQGT